MPARHSRGCRDSQPACRRSRAPHTSQSQIGPERLGDYQIVARLGEGGMGSVFKARHARLDKIVALKVLSKGRTGDPNAVARFEREMKAVGKISHPNIVQGLDARDVDGRVVLVMEFADGLDVGEVVRRVGPLNVADACEIVRQTALGLQTVHKNGMVHRDIKPSNLMLAHRGAESDDGGSQTASVKILDLGLALLDCGLDSGAANHEVTDVGQIMGTADYMAPEQASDSHRVDIRADIYSLGCTLYKLLSGKAPFSGPRYEYPMKKCSRTCRHRSNPSASCAGSSQGTGSRAGPDVSQGSGGALCNACRSSRGGSPLRKRLRLGAFASGGRAPAPRRVSLAIRTITIPRR